jgi:glutathione synthase/RimK-type ligase-like ATP-grasp enzyme
MVRKIGLLVGREWSFPPVFIEQVKRRHEGVIAEFVMLGGTRMNEPCPYALIIDRISHQVPYYRSYLKNAHHQGVPVINNPFMWTADDKYFQASLASRLGVASPRTLVLPNKDYVPQVVHAESLRNLVYPLDWAEIAGYVGFPCVLKDAHGDGAPGYSICHTVDELIECYNRSGQRTMIAQQYIAGEQYVRCLVLGQKEVLPVWYQPQEQRYGPTPAELPAEVQRRLHDDSLKLVRALGYDLNAVDWALHEGTTYVIDFMNPAPPLDVNFLTQAHFQWVVEHMVDLAIRLAKSPHPPRREPLWATPFLVKAE